MFSSFAGTVGRMQTVVATDGACVGNPGPGGWAWYIDENRWAAGGKPGTTNNQMELVAVLEVLQETGDDELLVLCDSKYVIDALTKWRFGWKKRGWRKADGQTIANKDLFTALDAALVGRKVTFEWVRGHNGHPLNEAADVRARASAEAIRDGRNVITGP